MKKLLWLAMLSVVMGCVGESCAQAPYVTLNGTINGPNGLPLANTAITLTPTQPFFIPGINTTQQIANIYGNGAPTGTCAVSGQFYSNNSTIPPTLYQCIFGVWVLVGNGSGGTPAGANFSLQYNNSGTFGGVALNGVPIYSTTGVPRASTTSDTVPLSISGQAATVGTIAGLVTQGTNVTVTGAGTLGSPFVVSSSVPSAAITAAIAALSGCSTSNAIYIVTQCSAATASPAGNLMIPGTSTFKFLAGSPTASGNTNVVGAVAGCLSQPCNVYIDPAYSATDTYSSLADKTFINDARYAQSTTTAYNWATSSAVGYYDANERNCIRSNQPGLTVPVTFWEDNCLNIISSSTVPGWNKGDFWTVQTGLRMQMTDYSAGLIGGFIPETDKPSIGDLNGVRSYVQYTSGFIAPMDEGIVPLAATATEISTMYTGNTVSHTTNGLNQTVLSLGSPANITSLGNGRPVIDKTTGVVAGSISGLSGYTVSGIATATVSGFTPIVSVCGVTTGAIATPNQPINGGHSQSISLSGLPTGLSSGITVGMQISIAGAENGIVGGHVETEIVSSAGAYNSVSGTQTITANLIYPYAAGASVCGGGLQGWVEQVNYTSTGFRYLQYVIGSPSASTVLITIPWGSSGLVTTFVQTGPINIYQGGILVDLRDSNATNLAVTGNQLTVGPNSAAWNASDVVEVADLISGLVNTVKAVAVNNNPFAPVIMYTSTMTGPTLTGSSHYTASNGFGITQLRTHGGKYFSPTLVQTSVFGASMGAGLVLDYAPEGGAELLLSGGVVPPAAVFVGPWQTSNVAVTACAVNGSNVLTVTAVNTAVTGGGQTVKFSGFDGACAFLDGVTSTTTSATGTTLVMPLTHAPVSMVSDTGTGAVGSTLTSYYPWYDDTAQKNMQFTPATGVLNFNVTAAQVNGSNVCTTASGCSLSANITLTTATSDAVTITGVTSSSKCSFSATNATAAGLTATTGALYYGVTANTFTLNHAATTAAAATYGVVCTVN